ncbi:MAG TPA: hypothetical protein VEO53_01875 [Candidatus Binatia bacterium]|nr:hypothetical protein [Candidatus Binatia bacterium]
MKLLVASAVLTGACAPPILACDLCAIYSATQARGEIGQGPFLGVAEQFSHFGTVQREGRAISDPAGQYLDSSIAQVFGGYNFNERFGVQFNLPVIYRAFKRPDGAGGIDRGTESGLGDVALLGNLVAFLHETKALTFRWNVLGGVKFPTGGTDRLREELHEVEDPVGPPNGIHGHDLTRGTGSFDGIVGSGIFIRWDRSFLAANAQYAIRSEGDFAYRFANDLTWSGGPGLFVVLSENHTFSLQAVVSGEDKGLDTFHGNAPDTGLTAVYLGPQLSFTWRDKLSAQVGVDVPVSIANTSLQTVPDYRIRARVTWHF